MIAIMLQYATFLLQFCDFTWFLSFSKLLFFYNPILLLPSKLISYFYHFSKLLFFYNPILGQILLLSYFSIFLFF